MTKQVKVTPEYRTNNLHQEGGGYQVFVVHKDKPTRVYDNVQSPDGYIRKIKSGPEWQSGKIIDIYYRAQNETT